MEHEYTRGRAEQLAMGLGWFSIGLGLAELLAPRRLARTIGMPDAGDATLRAFGAREIGNGLAILTQPDRAHWLWARTGGDAIDMSYLMSGMRSEGSDQRRLVIAIGAVLGVTALDLLGARQLSGSGADATPRRERRTGVKVERVVTINRDISEVYRFWRDFENLPRFMRHLESVQTTGGNRSRWRARGPAGMTVEWEAELLQDRPDEWIAWRSTDDAQVQNSGSVRFARAPGSRGTELRVQLQYAPPAGGVGRTIARMFGEEPDQQIKEDLRRFKQLMETGEIPVSDGPSLWRPAQPAANEDDLRALTGVSR